ncbi:alpha-N-acetylglucosaminidase [Dysgonomonas sp. GY617]|uniref:alpha-N-acetylglucosaminidase n=1 Tax=Dysgonomonas sp. GY617 TaxID=2780420 RepID=UPI001883EE30|nr:alpha-N-acetylglucosaminidase [Dysgonomonas sp. GY617]MBF0575647.1 alpha-N-acetylglucosaminidase [Dysgonomonas sp. GY617]
MKKHLLLLSLLTMLSFVVKANPVNNLLERIDKGSSRKFKIELIETNQKKDFFELDQDEDKVVIRGNNYMSIATGLNWYLKYYAHIHLSWNAMTTTLPEKLPMVKKKERRETEKQLRYYLNYCTYSYSMAFWDWERWEKELDWMALHGVNLPLALTGTETVWYNVLDKLGYSKDEINQFIAGSGFLAWWHMNNLEGWGGPNSDRWYKQQVELQKNIVNRMREYGIQPVFPGYAGMLPSNAKEKLGVNVSDPGLWCDFRRPAFLQPTDPNFEKIADLYYSELEKLFGKANYYAIDPFHEGGSIEGVDLDLAGKAIMRAMKKANPDATWVAQAWQANPRPQIIENLDKGDLLILDLFSESRPMWGDKESSWYREDGYGKHNWVYCMLLNFGERPGLMGKMDALIDGYYNAQQHNSGQTLVGVGATMEGIENNPMMYELLFELPWRNEKINKDIWLAEYATTRYGGENEALKIAWQILGNTIYNCPKAYTQEGPVESVLCARPALEVKSVSSWGTSRIYYSTDSIRLTAQYMLSVADNYRGNANFEHDLIEVIRQAISDKAYYLQKEVSEAYESQNKERFKELSHDFLALILAQDSLLETKPEFMLGRWLEQSKKIGSTDAEKKLYEWNARTQITTWGPHNAAEKGGLRDYAYKLWSGLLRDVYYPRWSAYFAYLEEKLNGDNPSEIDFYKMEEAWTLKRNLYPNTSSESPIERSKIIYGRYVGYLP